MIFKLIKEPELFNWSGNPLVYAIACLPYTATQQQLDIKIQFTLQVETVRDSDVFQDIKSETLSPDAAGITRIDVSSLADAYLKYEFPALSTLASGRCDKQSRRFKMRCRYFVNGAHVFDDEFSSPCIIAKGGLPYDGAKQTDSWVEVMGGKILQLNTYHIYDYNQPAFASFMYLHTAPVAEPKFTCEIRKDTGETLTNHSMPFNLLQGDIFYLPIQKLVAQAGTDRLSVMIISFLDDDDETIQEFVFSYRQRRFFKAADLLFINSLGGIDCLRLYGELQYSAEYDQSVVTMGVPSAGSNEMLPAELKDVRSSALYKFSGNTGFVSKNDEALLKAIMLNRLAFQVTENNFLLPVIVTKKALALAASTAFLYDAVVEWTEANRHSFFSQLSTGTYTAISCPALVSFDAQQETSTSLRITWNCPYPYAKINVIVSNGTPAEDVNLDLEGSYGSQLISISFTGDIVVTGRLFCGYTTNIDGTITPDLGPASIKNITLVTNRPPVATADYYELNIGHSTPQQLTGSVLANDTDPDGDAIEVVAASGTTMQGGFYSINAAGIVQYTPPYPSSAATDQFNYTVQEVGNPASNATSFVVIAMVTAGGTEIVFAKVVYASPLPANPGYGVYQSVVYIKYFADALCTITKNVTFLNLSFNYKKVYWRKVGSNPPFIEETVLFVVGTGFQNQIHSGSIATVGTIVNERLTFVMLPGTGYTIA